MPTPVLHPSSIREGQGPGVSFRIEGELVPALHLNLDGRVPVYFEHHVLLWKQPQVDVAMHQVRGAFKRAVAGMPIFMTEARGAGDIAFSRDTPGQVLPLALAPGQEILVREHQLIAATGTVGYTFERIKGAGSMLFGAQGFFQDKFTANEHGGVVWLHGHGNVFDVELEPGETIDVEPGAWVYRDRSVGYSQKVFGLKTGIFAGGASLVFNRFTGPGRVGLQSGFYGPGESGAVAGSDKRAAAGAGVLGAVLGGALGG